MTRKSSLIELSKAYEQVLMEMNLGTAQAPQNVLIRNPNQEDEKIQFTAPAIPENPQSAQKMANTVNSADMEREKCPCETGNCQQQEIPDLDEEENCEECEGNSHHNDNLDMAKSEIYSIKKTADMLLSLVDCSTKMEAWMLSKLVKASDYLLSVKNVMEYDSYEKQVKGPMDDFSNDMIVVSKITNMLNGEGRHVNEKVLRRIIFNLEILKETEKL
jgi:hypothetical protein